MVMGRGCRFEGNVMVRFVRVCFCARPCHRVGSILVFRSQLEYVSVSSPPLRFHTSLPEAIQRNHLLHRHSHQYIQHHTLIWHSSHPRMFLHIMLLPLPRNLKIQYIPSDIPRHQSIQPHRERTCHAASLRPSFAATVSYMVVGA